MKCYQHGLEQRGYQVQYISFENASIETVLKHCSLKGFASIHYVDPIDYLADRRLKRYARLYSISLKSYESPNFFCSTTYLEEYFGTTTRYRLTDFYIAQRKRFGILIENGLPAGSKWTFDTENRKRIPSDHVLPAKDPFINNLFIREAQEYVQLHFSENPGDVQTFRYAITPADAQASILSFLHTRFSNFGTYQDSIKKDDAELYHSLLTPALNIGLLSPHEIIDSTVTYARQENIPLNSVEGFIRQIIGWREFIRAIYHREGGKQRTSNFFEHKRMMPVAFWQGSSGIEPVDDSIHKVLTGAYTHHIERLMILGNFMLLCEIHPDEVYRWFMELFIDAYDWVMVPNVYGMSQFADGGMMSTKPYISGSNYVLKMSDYKKGKWSESWDALFWTFIDKHRSFFLSNPRLSMMVKQIERFGEERLSQHKRRSTEFLNALI